MYKEPRQVQLVDFYAATGAVFGRWQECKLWHWKEVWAKTIKIIKMGIFWFMSNTTIKIWIGEVWRNGSFLFCLPRFFHNKKTGLNRFKPVWLNQFWPFLWEKSKAEEHFEKIGLNCCTIIINLANFLLPLPAAVGFEPPNLGWGVDCFTTLLANLVTFFKVFRNIFV